MSDAASLAKGDDHLAIVGGLGTYNSLTVLCLDTQCVADSGTWGVWLEQEYFIPLKRCELGEFYAPCVMFADFPSDCLADGPCLEVGTTREQSQKQEGCDATHACEA